MNRMEVVEAGIAAFNRGDFDVAHQFMDPLVQWQPRLATVDTPTLSGVDAVVRAWHEQSEMLGGTGTLTVDLLTAEDIGGGAVLAEIRMSGVGSASGIAVADEYAAVFTFRRSKIVRVDHYDSRDDALADLA